MNTTDKSGAVSFSKGFREKVKTLYNKSSPGSWKHEEKQLLTILSDIEKKISAYYDFIGPIGLGGSGIVIKVHDRRLKVDRALKVPRPHPGKQVFLANILGKEINTILNLSHDNIIQIYFHGETSSEPVVPFYVMEYIEGVRDIEAYFKEVSSLDQVLGAIHSILEVVAFIHSKGLIHMDLKPGNILIRPDGEPLITDFGFAKWQSAGKGSAEVTWLGGTEGYMHPKAREFIRKVVGDRVSDPNRLLAPVKRGDLRAELKSEWDLYSLGKTFLSLLQVLHEKNQNIHLTPYVWRYLKLLACRLLVGENSSADTEDGIGLGLKSFKEIAYRSAEEARKDIEKLTGQYDLTKKIPELDQFLPTTIQVSTIATTPFTERMQKLLETPDLKRLSVVTQLGLLNLVYPTANHTRMEHSLGTFSMLCRYILALYNDPYNPLFRQIMREEDIKAVLLAGLLHDLGQFPMAHDIEEACPTISHERLGIERLDESETIRRIIKTDWGIDPARVGAIITADPRTTSTTSPASLRDRILHTLISGPIDADKVDYLLRDCKHLGLRYAEAIDIDRFLRCLTIVYRSESGGETYAALGVHEKGKIAAETIAFTRYAMYGQVYWHHTYRAIKTMLYHVIWEAIRLAEGNAKKLYEEFRDFVFGVRSNLVLLSESQDTSSIRVPPLHSTDFQVLEWWAVHSGARGRKLIDHIYNRRLYKRVAVRSYQRSKHIWNKVAEFYKANRSEYDAMLSFQKALQTRLCSAIKGRDVPYTSSPFVSAEKREAFLMEATRTLAGSDSDSSANQSSADSDGDSAAKLPEAFLVLLDFPPVRPKDIPLEFVVEDDRHSLRLSELTISRFEESQFWKKLSDESHQLLGKVRLYVHPRYSDFVRSYLSRDDVDRIIEEAIRDVDR